MSDWRELSVQRTNEKNEMEKVTFIDICDPDSYTASHIPRAIQLDDKKVAEDSMVLSEKEKPLIVSCYQGISSQGAAGYFAGGLSHGRWFRIFAS